MDFLDENFNQSSDQVNLEDMATAQAPAPNVPQATVRNRAALSALLSDDPEKAIERYNLLRKEASEGGDVMASQAQENLQKSTDKLDLEATMGILSNPQISLEDKKRTIEQFNSPARREPVGILVTKALSLPSKGESPRQEAARLNASEFYSELNKGIQDRQALVNSFAAKLPEASAKTIAEIFAVEVLPGATAVTSNTARVALETALGENKSLIGILKSVVAPGHSMADVRKRLESFPPAKRAELDKALLEAINSDSGILFPSENSYNSMKMMQKVFGEGGYSSTEKWLDTVVGVLDIVGLGTLLKAGIVGTKGTVAAGRTAAAKPFAYKGAAADVTDVVAKGEETLTISAPVRTATEPAVQRTAEVTVPTPATPTTGAFDSRIAKLEDEKASLLGEAGNLAEPGAIAALTAQKAALVAPRTEREIANELQELKGITSKEAKKQAKVQHANEVADYAAKNTRIDNAIEQNRSAATVTQRVAELEKQIELLTKRNTDITVKKNPVAEVIERIEANALVRKENPASPANIYQATNPEKARAAHAAVAKSSTDDVAEGLYGVGRSQAIINDVVPQHVTESGRVTSKVPDIDRDLRAELQIDDDLANLIHDTGRIEYTLNEKNAALANIFHKVGEATGMVAHDAESGFVLVGGRGLYHTMYGTSEGGFSMADEAISQAKYAFSHLGVKDGDITLMKREGVDYVPTTMADSLGVPGDYKIKVSVFRDISPDDIVNFEELITIRNWSDSMRLTMTDTQGSLTRTLFDAASVIDPKIAKPASVAVDLVSRFEKRMLEKATAFSDQFEKLKGPRQAAVTEYLKEANYNRIKFSVPDLVVRGFNGKEISTIASWKSFWDHHYYLENYDVVRTLSASGYKMFKNGNTELYAKPIPKNQNIGWFYDPSVNDVVRWGQGEGDVLYAAGGNYAKLRRPTTFNGIEVEHMIVRNTPTEYLRAFRDSDAVLPYRDGYFQLQYKKNARFIDEKGPNGVNKTIAVAGDSAEAAAFVSRMAASSGKTVDDFIVRGDVNGLQRSSDEWWDLASSGGRVSQRHRGKILEDSSGLNHLGKGEYVVNPVDSAVRAARSISGRTATRPMIETAKARFMNQFGDTISTRSGVKSFPSKLDDIGMKGEPTSKLVRDARTNFEYIRYLENGYINQMDNLIKQGFHAAATKVGTVNTGSRIVNKTTSLAERALYEASDFTLSSAAKGAVFTSMIVSSVFRQWIVQPHQILRTIGYNPIGWANGGVLKLSSGYLTKVMGVHLPGTAMSDMFGKTIGATSRHVNIDDFAEFVRNSGMLDSVDKSNLVRGTLLDAADSGNRATRTIAKYTTTPARTVGFDMGESLNLISHAAAVYEARIRNGANLKNLAERDEAYAEIRAISGAMNSAGDMAYNMNLLGPLLQFAQVGHKMLLLQTNRIVEPMAARRMLAFDLAMWGSPLAGLAAWIGYDILPEDDFYREAFINGIESALMNNMLGGLEDYSLKTDFHSLSPYDMGSFSKFYEALSVGGIQKAILNSPSGQMFLKDGGKFQNAMSNVLRIMGGVRSIDETPEALWLSVKAAGQMLSGVSNMTKARVILETGKVLDSKGAVVSEGLGPTQALLQVFGFGPSSAADLYDAVQKTTAVTKAHKEAVTKDYNEIVRYYKEVSNQDNQSEAFHDGVVNVIMQTYENDMVALEIIQGLLARDLQSPETTMAKLFEKRIALAHIAPSEFRLQIKTWPIPEDQRARMLNILDDVLTINKGAE